MKTFWRIFLGVDVGATANLIQDTFTLHFYGFTFSKNWAIGFIQRRKVVK